MSQSSLKKPAHQPSPKTAPFLPMAALDASPPSEQAIELNAEVLDTLGRLNALIDNRGAWIDAIEGCREAVSLLRSVQGRLHEIIEGTQKVESDLASARNENEQLNAMHAELQTVERNTRSECDRYREENAAMSLSERELRGDHDRQQKAYSALLVTADELRTSCENRHAEIEGHKASASTARKFAQEIIRELGS